MAIYTVTNIKSLEEDNGTSSRSSREMKLWVLCVVIFMVNVNYELIHATALFNSVALHSYFMLRCSLVFLAFNSMGLVLLGNGLFGKKWKKMSLVVYIVAFELASIVLCCVRMTLTFDDWKHWVKSCYPMADSTVMAICIWLLFFFSAAYHFLAAWIVNKYRKAARQ